MLSSGSTTEARMVMGKGRSRKSTARRAFTASDRLHHSRSTGPMIYSMTGYAVAARELESAVLNLELRSVNHRYLDVQFRLPDELRVIEPALRETIAARLNRGKVECRISFTPTPGSKSSEIDEALLRQLIDLDRRIREALPAAQSLTARGRPALARHPGRRHAAGHRAARRLPGSAGGRPRGIHAEPRTRRREAESHAPRARDGDRKAPGGSRAAHASGDRRFPGKAFRATEGSARQRRRRPRAPGGRALREQDRRRRGAHPTRRRTSSSCAASWTKAASWAKDSTS